MYEYKAKLVRVVKGKYGRLLGSLFRLYKEFKPTNEMRSYNQILLDEEHATYYDGGKR